MQTLWGDGGPHGRKVVGAVPKSRNFISVFWNNKMSNFLHVGSGSTLLHCNQA